MSGVPVQDDRCSGRQSTGRAGRRTIEAIQGWIIAHHNVMQSHIAVVAGGQGVGDQLTDMVKLGRIKVIGLRQTQHRILGRQDLILGIRRRDSRCCWHCSIVELAEHPGQAG